MILAAIISLSLFCSGPATVDVSARAQSSQQPPADVKSTESSSGQSNTVVPQTTPASPKMPSDSSQPSQKKPAPVRRKRPSAAKNSVPCKTPADPNALSTASHASATTTSEDGAAATSSSAAPDLPCAPAKVVVRNGGTTEAAVRLTGGAAAVQNSPQRANTDRLLRSTEEALKKISGMQLDSGQQETVKQVHQYTAQSKTALESGNLELAHNLALKAHLLADQLVKGQT